MVEIALMVMIGVVICLFVAAVVSNSKLAGLATDLEDAQLRDAKTIERLQKAASKYAIESKAFQSEVAELKKDLEEYEEDMEEASATIEEQGVRIRCLLDDIQAMRQAKKDLDAATDAMDEASKLIESQAATIGQLERKSATLWEALNSSNKIAIQYRQQYLEEKTFANDVLTANEQLADAVSKAREALGFRPATDIEPSVN